MQILYRDEHAACKNYDNFVKALVDVVKIEKGGTQQTSATENEIVILLEGRMAYVFDDHQGVELKRGQLLFCPAGARYSYEAMDSSMFIIFRINKPLTLCEQFPIEKLYNKELLEPVVGGCTPLLKSPETHIGVLEVNSQMWHFLYGIVNCLTDGIKCQCWCNLKIDELLILLRGYYSKESLRDFFFVVLSEDTAFSEYVRIHWRRFLSVQKLADSMELTRKQFTTRFVRVFGESPIRWMNEKRAEKAHKEITATRKTFKDISVECGFSTDTELTRFCKKQFGVTPSELRKNGYRQTRK